MNLPYFIARRYLFAKKSHNVINIISLISAVGIAIGTMALVVVMSVYNGFEELVKGIYSQSEADLVVVPVRDKFFSPIGDTFSELRSDPRISSISEIIQENVFITYDGNQSVAEIRGVDSLYAIQSGVSNLVLEGKFELEYGQVAQAVVGRTLARQMQIRTRFLSPLELYFPERKGKISMLNPSSSLRKEVVFPVGIISIEQNFDKHSLFVPISLARRLLDYCNEVSRLELRISDGENIAKIQSHYQELLGDGFQVLNRYQQNETVYKMMTYEKVAIYTILLFIILVVSCNVFGSLTMLIIEKRDDIKILGSMGASKSLLRRLFTLEGWLITFWGAVIGIVVGIALCMVQTHFGIIKMPGNFMVKAYPVVLQLSDVLITFTSVLAIGFIITSLPARKILPKILS